MKIAKILLAWTLTVCLLIAPFGGSVVLAFNANNAPIVTASIDTFDYVAANTPISVEFTAQGDSTLTSCEIRLEGAVISNESSFTFTPAELELDNGSYTLVAEAVDSNGEVAIRVFSFVVTDSIDINFHYAEDESITPSEDGAFAAYYEVEPLNYSVNYGSTSNGNISSADTQAYDPVAVYEMTYYNIALDTSSVSGLPYQIFNISLDGKTEGEVVFRYSGSTLNGERIAVKAYNPGTDTWDVINTFIGSDSVSSALDVATYAQNDAIQVAVMLDYVTNGSDTMIWSTDPQHYTKFEDLNEYYYKVYQFAAEQYVDGKAGYILTTGDLVDDRPSASVAAAQWQVADTAMEYVEAVGMPNGLVSGNHDVGDFKKPDYSDSTPTADYSKFYETFPASRYNTQPWYGGSLNNNASHYDLVTIGNVDFVILHLGYGVEATDETIVWANDVLQTYSHRTAIIATHEYLDAGAAVRSDSSRAQLIFDRIIDPNPNVKAILCGHDDGSLCLEKIASDGRTVYEILSDYQFVEAEDPDFYENPHYIGSVPSCCGDGYIRMLKVSGDTLSNVTYSPVTGRYNPYGDRENFSIDLNCGQPNRHFATTAFSAYVLGDEVDEPFMTNSAIVITGANSTTYHHINYTTFPEAPDSIAMQPVDLAPLQALIADAESIAADGYTEASFATLTDAIAAAKAVQTDDDTAVKEAYVALSKAVGALKTDKAVIDPATLTSMHKVDFTLSKWLNNDTSVLLTNNRSHITPTQTEAGGIHMTRSPASTNTWPSARYSTKIVMKPSNGKVYLNLDIDADSAWCIYADITQGSLSTTVRFNFAIENAFNSTSSDGFEGEFKGVYDVTEALTENGLDPNCTFTVDRLILYIVPGDVTYDYIDFMTDTATGDIDTSELDNLIASVEAMNEADYTPSTWKAVQTAITAAQKVKNNADTAQSDINLAILDVQKAIDKLKKVADIIPEPENSLLPADEGLWEPSQAGTMNIYRDENNYTVFENTNGQWPNATYTFTDTPYMTTVADHQLSIQMDITSESSVLVMFDNAWVRLNNLITTNVNSAQDIKSGSYDVQIPLSSIPDIANKETVSIKGVRIFSVGAADASAVIVKKFMVDEYVAPPPVYDTTTSLLPTTQDDTVSPSTTGSHHVTSNGSIVINSPTEGYRVQIIPEQLVLFDMNTLNAIHMYARSNVPFKLAFHLVNYNDPSQSKWLTTSDEVYNQLFTVTDDRVDAGSYDVFMEAKKYCSAISDLSSMYMESVTIVTTGEGTFSLNELTMVARDTTIWDEDMTTYGPAATPTNPYYQHCSPEAPQVAHKVDLLNAVNLNNQHLVTGWQTYGNQALNLNVNLAQTPYLYYSVALPADANFTFALYNNSTNAPWLFFRDATGEGVYMNQGAANWDAYTNREQYATYSETGCIDLREYRKTATNNSWIVNQLNFYNSTGKNVIVNYMFFGSAPIEPVKGDINGDNTLDSADTFALYRVVSGDGSASELDMKAADLNKDGEVNMIDAMLLYRITSGAAQWPEE